jgi:hypothetical protein
MWATIRKNKIAVISLNSNSKLFVQWRLFFLRCNKWISVHCFDKLHRMKCLRELEILKAVTITWYVFRDVSIRSLVKIYRRFGGTYCLHFHDRTVSHATNSTVVAACLPYRSNVKMKAECFSETSVKLYQTIWRHIPLLCDTIDTIHPFNFCASSSLFQTKLISLWISERDISRHVRVPL